jgi:hypothetical protein
MRKRRKEKKKAFKEKKSQQTILLQENNKNQRNQTYLGWNFEIMRFTDGTLWFKLCWNGYAGTETNSKTQTQNTN